MISEHLYITSKNIKRIKCVIETILEKRKKEKEMQKVGKSMLSYITGKHDINTEIVIEINEEYYKFFSKSHDLLDNFVCTSCKYVKRCSTMGVK